VLRLDLIAIGGFRTLLSLVHDYVDLETVRAADPIVQVAAL
jgi:hypothetical protein